jgi:mannose-6-phosphate isomerase-like protein (cupin superfamily)
VTGIWLFGHRLYAEHKWMGMMNSKTTGLTLGVLLAAGSAQAAPVDHYTLPDLAKEGLTLKSRATTSGAAGDNLAQYANHHTMLTYRSKDGGGEIHARYADIFYIVQGKATLLSEGTLEGSHEESPGEIRGNAVTVGKTTRLSAGDVVHIPAGTPHQLLVAKGDELLYFVIKVKERD